MTNINLTSIEENVELESTGKEWGGFLLAIIAVVIIYLGVFGYSYWLRQDLDKKNQEYNVNFNTLSEKGKSVFDFRNRLEAAKPLVAENNDALEVLGQIEKAVIPEVYLEEFDFKAAKGQIDLNFITSRYGLVANQIASLKKLDYFSEIEISKTTIREDGKISFPLKLTIKNN